MCFWNVCDILLINTSHGMLHGKPCYWDTPWFIATCLAKTMTHGSERAYQYHGDLWSIMLTSKQQLKTVCNSFYLCCPTVSLIRFIIRGRRAMCMSPHFTTHFSTSTRCFAISDSDAFLLILSRTASWQSIVQRASRSYTRHKYSVVLRFTSLHKCTK